MKKQQMANHFIFVTEKKIVFENWKYLFVLHTLKCNFGIRCLDQELFSQICLVKKCLCVVDVCTVQRQ